MTPTRRPNAKKSRGKDGKHKRAWTPTPEQSPMKGSPFKDAQAAGGVVKVIGQVLQPHEYRRNVRVGKGTFATCYSAESCETGEVSPVPLHM